MDKPLPLYMAKCANAFCGLVIQVRNMRNQHETACFLIENYWKPVEYHGRRIWLCPKCAKGQDDGAAGTESS